MSQRFTRESVQRSVRMMLSVVREVFLIFVVGHILIDAQLFQGGTITYKIRSSSGTNVSILLSQTYMYTYVSTCCNKRIIIPHETSATLTNTTLECFKTDGQSNTSQWIVSKPSYIDHSASLNLSVVQIFTVLELEDVSHCVATFAEGNWRQLTLPTGIDSFALWSVRSVITLQRRSNGKHNTPPVAVMISPIFVPADTAQAIFIPTMDADNDQVRCRFATTPDECADVCYPDSLPAGTMLLSNCTLLLPESNAIDWYAVAIMVRDQC